MKEQKTAMKKFVTLTIVTLFFSITYAQDYNFLLQRPLLNSIDSIEKVEKGEKFEAPFTISVSKNYFPNADKFDLANPLIFFRKENPFRLEMNYYYSVPDNVVRLISYSWDGNSKQTDKLNSIFEKNAEYFSSHFGKKGEIKNEIHDTWSQKSLTWQNDIVHIHQFMVTGKNTNRVRVLISWK